MRKKKKKKSINQKNNAVPPPQNRTQGSQKNNFFQNWRGFNIGYLGAHVFPKNVEYLDLDFYWVYFSPSATKQKNFFNHFLVMLELWSIVEKVHKKI